MSVTSKASELNFEQEKSVSAYAWLVWGLGAAYFFCDYFARVSPGVMVRDLMQSFSVTAFDLGLLSAYFYYPYVAMQIPVGVLVDKFGVRRLLISMCFLTGLGCYLFGSATILPTASFGRFLIGFGAAFAFVSALKLASEWFPASRFGMLAGLTQALGMLGAWVGEAPVAHSVQIFGWRNTMFIMAAVFMLLTGLMFLFVHDNSVHKAAKRGVNKIKVLPSLRYVLSGRQTWLNALYAGLVFAPTAVFAELWGPTYLEHVHQLTHMQSATANGMIFLGWGIGGPLFGFLSDMMQKRRPIMFLSALLGCMLMSAVLFIPNLSGNWISFLLFLFGISNTGVAISYAVSSEINPRRYSGISMAFTNMMSVIIGAILQPIVGYLVDAHAGIKLSDTVASYSASDFTWAMSTLPFCLFLAIFLTFTIKETHCTPVLDD